MPKVQSCLFTILNHHSRGSYALPRCIAMEPRDRLLAALAVILALTAVLRFSEAEFGGGWPLPEPAPSRGPAWTAWPPPRARPSPAWRDW